MRDEGMTAEQARQNVIYEWRKVANEYITKFDAIINNASHNRNNKVIVSIPTEHYPCVTYVVERYKANEFEVEILKLESEDCTDINISW